MNSPFNSALASLATESQHLTIQMLSLFSDPSREESAAFAQVWQGLSLERRRFVINQLVELNEDRFDVDFSLLYRAALSDPDEQVRRSAIDGLWEDESVSLVEVLIRLLKNDPSTLVRAGAATSLGKFVFMTECEDLPQGKGTLVRQVLEQTIGDAHEDREVVRRAVEAIAFINDDHIQQIISDTYAQRDEMMRISAVFAMGRNADAMWSDIVYDELQNASAAMRFEAARAAGEMQLERTVPQLIAMVQDTDAEVQQTVIWALGQIGGKRAESTLQKLVKSTNEAVSETAQEALDELEFASAALDLLVHEAEDDLDLVEIDLPAASGMDEDELADDEEEDPDGSQAAAWDDDPLELD